MSTHNVFAFEASGGHRGVNTALPGPDRTPPEPLPEREWGLSAGQVVAVVLAIVAACQVVGMF